MYAMQAWGMSEQEHNGKTMFQKFVDNVASTGQASKVTAFQQPSLMALAGLISTRLEAFDVSCMSNHAIYIA